MPQRRAVLGSLLALVGAPATAGCFTWGSITAGPRSEREPPRPPLPGDLDGELVPVGAPHPRSGEPADAELVSLEDVAEVDLELDGATLEYPDGVAFDLGEAVEFQVLEPCNTVDIYSDARERLVLQYDCTTFQVGADHPERPVLDDGATVTVRDDDGRPLLELHS